jgi:hypothetical protein
VRTAMGWPRFLPGVLLALSLACAPPEGLRGLVGRPPAPGPVEYLVAGATGHARELTADLPENSPEHAYAEAQLALADGDPSRADALLAGLDSGPARLQRVRLAVCGGVRLTPETAPPPGEDPILELGYGIALLAEGFRDAGLARLETVAGGALGSVAALVRARELDGYDETELRRSALERAWRLATPALRPLVLPEYLAAVREAGGGWGLTNELERLRGEEEAGSPPWVDLTVWYIRARQPLDSRDAAWELALYVPGEAFPFLGDLARCPDEELPRLAALALEVGDTALAARAIDRISLSPAVLILKGEYEHAVGRPRQALAQYAELFDDPSCSGLARLYAGVTELSRDRRAAADEHWSLVTETTVPSELAGTYLERDAGEAVAKADYYRANLRRTSDPGEAARLYADALDGGLSGKERARAAWRLATIRAGEGDWPGAAEAFARTGDDPDYLHHVAYWRPRMEELAGKGAVPPAYNWAYPFYELPVRGVEWWLAPEPERFTPRDGLGDLLYARPADEELDLLMALASAADDDLFDAYAGTLARYRRDDSEAQAWLALAYARRGYEVGDYDVRPEIDYASRALTGEGPGDPWVLPFAYPLTYLEDAESAGAAFGLDPLLLLALAREESRFDPEVVSGAGAVGLTQKMPATAAMLARELGLEDYDLRDPGDSLLLGAAYLRKMLDRFDGNLALALAGYNAGPGNARHWVASFKTLLPDIWLLLKPFDETRRYIVRVVGSYYRYRQLYGSDGR